MKSTSGIANWSKMSNIISKNQMEFNEMWGLKHGNTYPDVGQVLEMIQNYEYDYAQLDATYDELSTGMAIQMNAFRNVLGLSDTLATAADAEADAVIESLDLSAGDVEAKERALQIASQQIAAIYSNYQKKQEELNLNDEASILQKDLDKAKAVFEADKTEENLNAYNALVRKWNEKFGEYGKLEELSQDSIKKAEGATTATTGAAEATEKSVEAAAAYAEIVSQRTEAQRAAEQGYIDQLVAAKSY